MESVRNSPVRSGRIVWGRLLWAAPLTAFAAALANAFVYLVASALGAIPSGFVIASAGTPLTLGMVVVTTAVPAILAAVLLLFLGRFTARPIRNFVVVSAVVLVLSFATPLTIAGAPLSMVLSLEMMHVVAAVVIVGGLTTLTRRG